MSRKPRKCLSLDESKKTAFRFQIGMNTAPNHVRLDLSPEGVRASTDLAATLLHPAILTTKIDRFHLSGSEPQRMNLGSRLTAMQLSIVTFTMLCLANVGNAAPLLEKHANEGCSLKFNMQIAMASGIISESISNPISAAASSETLLAKARQQLLGGLNRAALQTLRSASSATLPSAQEALEVASLLSLVEASFGRPEGFEKASRQAALLVAQSAPENTSGPLIELGAAFLQSGQLSTALAHFDNAAAVARKLPDRAFETKALINGALVAARLGQSDTLTRAQAAQSAVQSLPLSQEQGQLLASVARVLTQMKAAPETDRERLKAAHVAASGLAEFAIRQRDQLLLADALGLLGELYYRAGQFNDAEETLRRAVAISKSQPDYEHLHRWLWLSGRVAQARGDNGTAFTHFEAAAKALIAIRARRVLAPAVVDGAESANQVFYDLADVLFKRATGQISQTERQALLTRGRDVIESSRVSEIEDLFRDPCISSSSLRTTKIETIDTSVAVFYPIFFADRIVLLVARGSEFEQVVVPVSRAEVASEIQRFRLLLEKRTTRQYLGPSRKLYSWLIAPVQPMLESWQVKTLVFVPDGMLRTIPVSALHDGKQFLVERFAVAVTPSLNLTDPRPLTAQPMQAVLSGMSVESQGFAALPSVEDELDQLGKLLGSAAFRNADFSVSRLEKVLSQAPANLVHIASHGQFSSNPSDTFLLTFDGKLTIDRLREAIAAGKLREEPLELLTLSACQTAAGDERSALGLAGVAIRAGARSALASLWFVNDESTSRLIVEFYGNLAKPGTSKAEAMRRAQFALMQDERYAHPAYWAPFLIIGNWL